MRYVSFLRRDGSASYGRLLGDVIADLGAVAGAPVDLKAALAAGGLDAILGAGECALGDVTLLPPIPNAGKIICVGLNYAEHIAETGQKQLGHPAIFTRWNSSLVGHGAAIIRPKDSIRHDYEGELAVIIGKAGRRIARDDAWGHIAGYSAFNDGSIRDWQRHNSQFTPGKNFVASGAFGPCLVTVDEAGDLAEQRVQTRLNGQLVQDQPIKDLIWDISAIIAYCSTFTTLEVGDVIATGTPGGVGDKREPPLYLKGGDRVEISIGRMGVLVNDVVDEE